MIAIDNLQMRFSVGFWGRTAHALRGISLTVKRGEIFGFLGPNGAGKTTTIKILVHLLKPTGGTARIDNLPVSDPAARKSVGYLPDQPYFYDYLTGLEFLRYCAELSGIPRKERTDRARTALRDVFLDVDPDLQLRKYSRGMLQRIGMAQAILHDPDLLILDEPMTGLDPVGRHEFKDLILRLKSQGKTIFFSSHILQDAEVLCDRVGMLVDGRLVSTGQLNDFAIQNVRFTDIAATYPSETQAHICWHQLQIADIQGADVRIRIFDQDGVQAILEKIASSGGVLQSVIPHRSSLEDIFLEQIQTGRPQQSRNEITSETLSTQRNNYRTTDGHR